MGPEHDPVPCRLGHPQRSQVTRMRPPRGPSRRESGRSRAETGGRTHACRLTRGLPREAPLAGPRRPEAAGRRDRRHANQKVTRTPSECQKTSQASVAPGPGRLRRIMGGQAASGMLGWAINRARRMGAWTQGPLASDPRSPKLRRPPASQIEPRQAQAGHPATKAIRSGRGARPTNLPSRRDAATGAERRSSTGALDSARPSRASATAAWLEPGRASLASVSTMARSSGPSRCSTR